MLQPGIVVLAVRTFIAGISVSADETAQGTGTAGFGLQSLVGAVVAIFAGDAVGGVFAVYTVGGADAAGILGMEVSWHTFIAGGGVAALLAVGYAVQAGVVCCVDIMSILTGEAGGAITAGVAFRDRLATQGASRG